MFNERSSRVYVATCDGYLFGSGWSRGEQVGPQQ